MKNAIPQNDPSMFVHRSESVLDPYTCGAVVSHELDILVFI